MAVRDYPGRDARQGEASPRADTGHRNRVNLIVTECGAPDPQNRQGGRGCVRRGPASPVLGGLSVASGLGPGLTHSSADAAPGYLQRC